VFLIGLQANTRSTATSRKKEGENVNGENEKEKKKMEDDGHYFSLSLRCPSSSFIFFLTFLSFSLNIFPGT